MAETARRFGRARPPSACSQLKRYRKDAKAGSRDGVDDIESRIFWTVSGLKFQPLGRSARSQSIIIIIIIIIIYKI
jgi:hypothetical protein